MCNESILSLENDFVKLSNKDTNASFFWNNFTDVILSSSGNCSIFTVLKNHVSVENVFPDTVNRPINCKDLITLGLETQIVIISKKQIESVTHTRVDETNRAEMMDRYVSLLPNQDVLQIKFLNGNSTIVFGFSSDIAHFANILQNSQCRATLDEDGKVRVTDANTGQVLPVDKSAELQILDVFEAEDENTNVFLYKPLCFGKKR